MDTREYARRLLALGGLRLCNRVDGSVKRPMPSALTDLLTGSEPIWTVGFLTERTINRLIRSADPLAAERGLE